LIIDQQALAGDAEPHIGTMDLDVGLQIGLLDEGRYRQLSERLRDAGFKTDTNEAGNPTRQRWVITNDGTVTVDFLIQPSRKGDRGGKLRNIEPDFAAIIAPGLRCAFRDRKQVTLICASPSSSQAARTTTFRPTWWVSFRSCSQR
jgi:hypothetical protein